MTVTVDVSSANRFDWIMIVGRGFLATTIVRQDKGNRPAEDRIGNQVETIRLAVQRRFDEKAINWEVHPGPTFSYSSGGWASLCVEISAWN